MSVENDELQLLAVFKRAFNTEIMERELNIKESMRVYQQLTFRRQEARCEESDNNKYLMKRIPALALHVHGMRFWQVILKAFNLSVPISFQLRRFHMERISVLLSSREHVGDKRKPFRQIVGHSIVECVVETIGPTITS